MMDERRFGLWMGAAVTVFALGARANPSSTPDARIITTSKILVAAVVSVVGGNRPAVNAAAVAVPAPAAASVKPGSPPVVAPPGPPADASVDLALLALRGELLAKSSDEAFASLGH